MMGKKDYQLFADALSLIENDEKRNEIEKFLFPVFETDNPRFDYSRFIEWVHRRQTNQSMKGTHYNLKYMPLGIK
jgi:hypothetical protein